MCNFEDYKSTQYTQVLLVGVSVKIIYKKKKIKKEFTFNIRLYSRLKSKNFLNTFLNSSLKLFVAFT